MKKRKDAPRRFPVLITVATGVFVSFMLSFFLGQSGILRLQQLRRDYDSLMLQNHTLAMENRQLVKEIQDLKRDPGTIEKIAREELHYASPHDLVLLVPSEDTR